jgi:hypothetical protein
MLAASRRFVRFVVVVASMSVFASADCNAQVIGSLDPDQPYYLRAVTSSAPFGAGKLYLLFHDSAGQSDHLSSVNEYGAIAAYSNSNASWSQGTVNAWGSPYSFQVVGSQACLVDAGGSCAAVVLGRFDPAELPSLHTTASASSRNYAATLRASIAQLNTGNGVATCPGNSSIVLYYQLHRGVADFLNNGARLLPFTYRADDYQALRSALEDTATGLMNSFPGNFGWTTYSQCFGAQEYETAVETAGALYELYKLNGNPTIRNYILAEWSDVSPQFITDGYGILNSGIYGYAVNGLAQYLKLASITQTLGVDALQGSFTITELAWIFYAQALDDAGTRTSCGGFAWATTYGGWVHALGSSWSTYAVNSDCQQTVGYHRLIVDGLLELHAFLRLANACPQPPGGYWAYACDNLPSNLLASLAWLADIQPADGSTPVLAPNSGPAVAGDTSYYATRMFYRLFSYLPAVGFSDATTVQYWFGGYTLPLSTIKSDYGLLSVKHVISKFGLVAPEVLLYYRQKVTGEVGW